MTNSVRVLAGTDTALHLVSAVLMYQSDAGHVYATSHKMAVDASNPARKVLGPGSPLTKKGLTSLARAIDVATAFAGFIPDNLLYSSPEMIAWWTPAAIRTTWFVGAERGLGEVCGPAAHPALVFVAAGSTWYVFALRDSERPDASTPLMNSPHFNVWQGGHICTGNVKLPPAVTSEAIAAYEDAFFRSRFTHPNHDAAIDYPGGMKQFWLDQLARPDIGLAACALKPAKETLGQAIKRIADQNHFN